MGGFRYGRRVGRRGYVSMPLWVPVLFWTLVILTIIGALRSI